MAKWTIGSYNRFLSESMSRYKHTRKVAVQHYREMQSRIDRPITRADIRNHPRIAKQTAERAFAIRPSAPPKIKPITTLPGRLRRAKIPLKRIFENLKEEQDQEAESSEDYEAQ